MKGHLPAVGNPASTVSTSSARAKINIQTILKERTNYYSLIGVSVDFSNDDELKKAYRVISRQTHPDKHGGDNSVFTVVAKAYETLLDPVERKKYDEGRDLDDISTQHNDDNAPPPLCEEIERNYFPERFGLHIFGDPYERKRQEMGYGAKRNFGK